MAADVGQLLTGWTHDNDHNAQDPSVQQMVQDHGSVSFGRFAAEPLAWEKRSVFAHNSRQEELRKLTAPGLVSQKKAFFEEYYKRARQLKAQVASQQTQDTPEEVNDENTLGCSSQVQEEQLPAVISDDPVAPAPGSSLVPSAEESSADERKCQEAHNIGYLTFNPLFSQTAGPQNIQQEDRSGSGEKQYHDPEFPCVANKNTNTGEALERRVLRPRQVVSNDNGQNNVAETRTALPKACKQSEGLKVACGKQGARKTTALINRPMKKSKDMSTSVIHIPRVDVRNSENRHSQVLKDPFHKRVEMKLRALSDRMSADKAAASSGSTSYEPPERAVTTCKSSYQNTDQIANSSRPSLCQNTGRFLAPSVSAAAQGSRRSSSNSTATGNLAAKIPVMPNLSQVGAKTSRNAQVTSKGVAGPTTVKNASQNKRKQWSTQAALDKNNAAQNKRKQWSTPAASDENNPKRGYVCKSMPRSARSSSENSLPSAKVPKIADRRNETKSECVQSSRSASHPVSGRNNMTKPTPNCNEQNRKVTSTRAGRLAGSSMKSNLTSGASRTDKNKTRQERPRWR